MRTTLDKIAHLVCKDVQLKLERLQKRNDAENREAIGLANKHNVKLPPEVYDFLYSFHSPRVS